MGLRGSDFSHYVARAATGPELADESVDRTDLRRLLQLVRDDRDATQAMLDQAKTLLQNARDRIVILESDMSRVKTRLGL